MPPQGPEALRVRRGLPRLAAALNGLLFCMALSVAAFGANRHADPDRAQNTAIFGAALLTFLGTVFGVMWARHGTAADKRLDRIGTLEAQNETQRVHLETQLQSIGELVREKSDLEQEAVVLQRTVDGQAAQITLRDVRLTELEARCVTLEEQVRLLLQPPIRILLADDDPILQRLIRMLLDQMPSLRHVGSVARGDEVLAEVAELRPELVLLDLTLPGKPGWDVLQELRALPQPPAVLVLTSAEEIAVERKAQQEGAQGFVRKSLLVPQLAEAIKAVSAGRTWFTPNLG